MSKGRLFAVILTLIGFGGLALQPVGQLGLALAEEQEPDVASPAPDEDMDEAAEEDSEGGETEAEEGSEDPE